MAKYIKLKIELTKEQRSSFTWFVRKGAANAMEIRRANVLLRADESEGRKRQKDVVIAQTLGISPQAMHDIKKNFLDRTGLQEPSEQSNGIGRKKRITPPIPPKCTGDVEAKIIAIACSKPPEGHHRWTLRLISERAVELEVYSRPCNPSRPVVCMDEQPIELRFDSRETIHLSEGNHSEKVDHEYIRNGTCCAIMFNESLGGWRRVTIKTQRSKCDWAEQMRFTTDDARIMLKHLYPEIKLNN